MKYLLIGLLLATAVQAEVGEPQSEMTATRWDEELELADQIWQNCNGAEPYDFGDNDDENKEKTDEQKETEAAIFETARW